MFDLSAYKGLSYYEWFFSSRYFIIATHTKNLNTENPVQTLCLYVGIEIYYILTSSLTKELKKTKNGDLNLIKCTGAKS